MLPEGTSEAELLAVVRRLNADPAVDGILVQLPLPPGIDEAAVLDAIDAAKDADGLHPTNMGCLVQKGRTPAALPCTPAGVMELLVRSGVRLDGAHAVVLGRSNIVGVPVGQLLLQANATVTMCHSRTADLPAVVRTADVLVAAIGKPLFVRADWLKPGAVVIDVGINSIPDATKKSGSRLVGDVDFEGVMAAGGVAAITPVPGGVGPMTIAMLLGNTVRAWERRFGLKASK